MKHADDIEQYHDDLPSFAQDRREINNTYLFQKMTKKGMVHFVTKSSLQLGRVAHPQMRHVSDVRHLRMPHSSSKICKGENS